MATIHPWISQFVSGISLTNSIDCVRAHVRFSQLDKFNFWFHPCIIFSFVCSTVFFSLGAGARRIQAVVSLIIYSFSHLFESQLCCEVRIDILSTVEIIYDTCLVIFVLVLYIPSPKISRGYFLPNL
jgi:hypothetical protein